MSTRSLTVFKDETGAEIAVLYRQCDGYPEGHGKELKNFLKGKKILNGISLDSDITNAFNGMGCLTAAAIAHFKKELGQFYLYPAGTRNCGEEYIYTVSGKTGDKKATIKTKEV